MTPLEWILSSTILLMVIVWFKCSDNNFYRVLALLCERDDLKAKAAKYDEIRRRLRLRNKERGW